MKRAAAALLILAALVSVWAIGWHGGINHAITTSEIWLNEYVEPEDGKGDWIINIDLDGETYKHVIWIY